MYHPSLMRVHTLFTVWLRKQIQLMLITSPKIIQWCKSRRRLFGVRRWDEGIALMGSRPRSSWRIICLGCVYTASGVQHHGHSLWSASHAYDQSLKERRRWPFCARRFVLRAVWRVIMNDAPLPLGRYEIHDSILLPQILRSLFPPSHR